MNQPFCMPPGFLLFYPEDTCGIFFQNLALLRNKVYTLKDFVLSVMIIEDQSVKNGLNHMQTLLQYLCIA
jgi:hypothetical protein